MIDRLLSGEQVFGACRIKRFEVEATTSPSLFLLFELGPSFEPRTLSLFFSLLSRLPLLLFGSLEFDTVDDV